ncbi:galactoside alpha-(1,2)-fucosyltransferase 2-like isoform X2 [Cherax quadricarinatus]|uniref:galactoside alpha-(1,2)-fucosyltransferase 2-like isoform X2 n=1 Tax=Cherax quadricarinatus TaxID=27406 RepID=UPI00387E8B04
MMRSRRGVCGGRGCVLVLVVCAGGILLVLPSCYQFFLHTLAQLHQLMSILQHPSVCQYPSFFYNETEIKGINSSVVSAGRCLPQPRYLPLPQDNQQDRSLPYITINRGGRIGNEICQYMSLAVLRKMFGVRASIHGEMEKYIGQFFHRLTLPVQDSHRSHNYTIKLHYDDIYKTLVTRVNNNGPPPDAPYPYPINQSIYIYNNPCPPDVLLPFRGQFRQEFTFREDIVDKARKHIDEAIRMQSHLADKNLTKITVHVRRKDYIKFLKERFNLEPVEKSYFERAFDFFRQRVPEPVFLVTSDEPTVSGALSCDLNVLESP